MTRPDPEGRFASMLRQADLDMLDCPLTGIVPPADPEPLRRAGHALLAAQGRPDAVDVLLFTSARAVRAMRGVLDEFPEAGERLASHVEVWVVGSRTGRAARAAGLPPDRLPDDFHGDALVRAARGWRDLDGVRILYPRALEGREEIPEGLREAGAEVQVVPAYRVVPRPEMARKLVRAVHSLAVAAIPLTAGSAARVLADAWQETGSGTWPDAVRVATIGPATRRAAEAVGIPVHGIADPHTLSGLVACLRRLV